ncbi:MAG: 5'-methylthioadenosine/S-adenosylhomocysteine nucleosidase [Selenomonadaceae bacterium]|nr:5'-methylthioadenosine/S-adenosylhomocysteine nucleosidase [Selenomonadaceae bacterium]
MRNSIIKVLLIALVTATTLWATTPTYAQTQNIENADNMADVAGNSAEKFYSTLPKAKGDYKSRVRPILIEGAMNTETEVLVRALKNPVTYSELNYLFVAGTYKDYPVVVVRTEQGMANAAAATALAIKKFNPVAVINQGTSGGQDPALNIGDIVIGSRSFDYTAVKVAYSAAGEGADLTNQEMRGVYSYDAASGKFQPYKEYFPDSTLFKIAQNVADANKNFNVVTGVIGTGNTWLQNIDYINFLHETYGSSCEEMETNAVAQICQNADVPFIGIRVLSDNITKSHDYVPETGKICQDFVLLVVEEYIRDLLKK